MLEKINSLPFKQRIALYIFIPVMGILAFWHFYYAPLKKEIHKLESNLRQTQQKLNEFKLKKKRRKKLEMEIAEKQAQFIKLSNLLPREKEIPDLLTSISNLGNECQLNFVLFQPQKERIKDFYAEVPVQLKVTSEFLNVKKFLRKLANTPRIINVESIHFKKAKITEEKVLLDVDMQLVTYRCICEEAKDKKNNKKKKKKKK
jgi:type IV pilus assembly protein PilO